MTTMCIISVIASPPLPLDVLIACSTSWWPHLGPVHTNPFSNENGAVLLRIRLSSTLQRRKRSPKTEPFENALQSGAIWKRCFLKTLFSSVDGENDAIWKRSRHQNRHDRAPDRSTLSIPNGGQTLTKNQEWRQFHVPKYIEMRMRRVHLSIRTECIKAFSKLIWRCSVDGRKRYDENDKCGDKSFWKEGKTAPFSFENGLVWTGP